MRNRVPTLLTTVRSPIRGPSYTNVTRAECLGQSHVGSLIVDSVSANPYKPRFIDCVSLLKVPLTPLAAILLPPSPQDSLILDGAV